MSDWVKDPGWVVTLAVHHAHADFITSTTMIDDHNTLDGYVTWCEDCDWSESFLAKNHSSMLAAWREAARARDAHHDTHTKEIE